MKGSKTLLTLTLTILVGVITVISVLVPQIAVAADDDSTDLDPLEIPKFTNQLDGPPPVFIPTRAIDPATGVLTDYYSIIETEFYQQILPEYDRDGYETGYPKTAVWGYGGLAKDAVTGAPLGFVRSAPSPTIEATRYVPSNVAWVNGIFTPYLFTSDPTIDPVNGTETTDTAIYPVTTTTYLHGGETQANYSGHPYSWTTWNGLQGEDYDTYARTVPNAAIHHYDNYQTQRTLWFHDRAIGLTRSNSYSGLSGFYLIDDPEDPISAYLPSGKYDMPLSIQDRNFNSDGSLKLPTENLPGPGETPFWVSEFHGDVITVNGKAWPNMNVDQGQYLFRVLDGSNARWYDITMSNGMPFTVISRDGNYLRSAVTTTSFTISPGERYDILIDFSDYAPGTKIVMRNSANAPYPDGTYADFDTTGIIMQFTVGGDAGFAPRTLPSVLNPSMENDTDLESPLVERTFTLFDFVGELGDSMSLLDGQLFKSPMSETPKVGSTEIWRIVDSTRSSHTIHIALAHVKLISRQSIDEESYDADWLELNGGSVPFPEATVNLELDGYLTDDPVEPLPIDDVWMDSIVVHPGEVVTFLVRFTPLDGREGYGFDATQGPNYIWYSHILDHEENEMMRQFRMEW
ncbi:MAG: multicopper oxidase domain-containing protein [Methanomassiliicoccales archaeon]